MLEAEELILRHRWMHLQQKSVYLLMYRCCPRRADKSAQDAQIVYVIEQRNRMNAPCVHVLEVVTRSWVGCCPKRLCTTNSELEWTRGIRLFTWFIESWPTLFTITLNDNEHREKTLNPLKPQRDVHERKFSQRSR
uniref:AlNc14C86G5516 protein n=1 Tax=Albugo laibachii Nc14 TaxID=890382 RepID=F0WFY3_9STRA|nr:AlNc14C86G5516 [Albugo laibachii Nc14]|eukprot:CCA20117.1 AlNc14C86G5516 [Albugo laibachii Nc14]